MTFHSSNLTISNTKLYIHADATVISEKAKIISGELEIIDEYLYKGHSTMTNYVYINAPIEKMINVLVTYDVLYFLDDFFGEDTNIGELPSIVKLLEIWRDSKKQHSSVPKINKLYNAIYYISNILKSSSPDSFFQKYTNSVVEHLSLSLSKKKYNTVNEYIKIRLITGGMYLLIDLIEYVHSIYLSKELLNNRNLFIRKLQRQCALIGALSNDLFSYAKEKHSSYNLINAYIITKEAINYNEAVIKSIHKVNDIHADFKSTLKKAKRKSTSLLLNDKLMVNKYFDALNVIVASSYHWQKTTNRYYHPKNVFQDMQTMSDY